MASVKVKFRPSIIEGKTGTLYLQVIHRRIVRSQKTKYKVYPDEWNARTARITPSPSRPDRHSILSRYRHEIKQDLFRLNECIANLTRKELAAWLDNRTPRTTAQEISAPEGGGSASAFDRGMDRAERRMRTRSRQRTGR